VRKLALGIEALAIAVLFGSFLASGGKLLAGAAAALLVLAGVLGLAGKRREMPGFWLWFASLLAYAFLYIPLVIVVIFSFNDSKLNAASSRSCFRSSYSPRSRCRRSSWGCRS